MRIFLVVLRVAALVLALGWATGNMRLVPAGSQAVVLRFGRVVGVQPSGLVRAWPRPWERVVLLPGAGRHMVLNIAAAADVSPGARLYLTGDGGIVEFDAAIAWRIADAGTYYVARDQAAAALQRIFFSAGVAVAAAHPLNDFLALRPDRAADPAAQEARRAVRGDLVSAMNARLAALARAGADMGVEVTRADITALLAPSATSHIDAIVDATQRAELGLAVARTEAAHTRQQADQTRDGLLSAAHASAAEQLSGARARTAVIVALETRMDPAGRPSLLDQIYRDRIGAILARAGSVSAVDAKSVSRLILPGSEK